jgi:hypothetical protein
VAQFIAHVTSWHISRISSERTLFNARVFRSVDTAKSCPARSRIARRKAQVRPGPAFRFPRATDLLNPLYFGLARLHVGQQGVEVIARNTVLLKGNHAFKVARASNYTKLFLINRYLHCCRVSEIFLNDTI